MLNSVTIIFPAQKLVKTDWLDGAIALLFPNQLGNSFLLVPSSFSSFNEATITSPIDEPATMVISNVVFFIFSSSFMMTFAFV